MYVMSGKQRRSLIFKGEQTPMAEKIVVALGGNALQSGKSEATAEAQLAVVKETCERIADISERSAILSQVSFTTAS